MPGTPASFALACATFLVWGITGPLFRYSDTWQLIINTGTTIVTFLMVFWSRTRKLRCRAFHLKLVERQFKALRRREERNKVNSTASASPLAIPSGEQP